MDLLDIPIEKLMSTNITSLKSSDTIAYSILKIIQKRLSRLPVLDNNELVGLFTSTDIIRVIHHSQSIEVLQQPLKNHMVMDTVTTDVTEKFETVIAIMAQKNISCLPIMEDKVVKGIYSNKDFLLFNIFWNKVSEEVIVDRSNQYLRPFSNQFILNQNATISQIIDVMDTHDLNYVLLKDEDHNLLSSVSQNRIIRSIGSYLMFEGMEMDYLNKAALDRVVTDSIFTDKIGLPLNKYRKMLNHRNIDSLFLKKGKDISYILNEETVRNIAYDKIIRKN